MPQRCRTLDLRSTGSCAQLPEELERLHPHEALLLISKTSCPLTWSEGVWKLVDGPSVYLTLLTRDLEPAARLSAQIEQQQRWLDGFAQLKERAAHERPVAEGVEALQGSILAQLEWEERVIFPAVSHFLQNDRAARELGYEHQGLRRFLPGLLSALQNGKAWERFSLDCIHLLEHHIEHEQRGMFPIYARLELSANC